MKNNINDKLLEKIMNVQRKRKESAFKSISSISLSSKDYHSLLLEYPGNSRIQMNSLGETFLGIKINRTNKITKVNLKWSDERRFKKAIREGKALISMPKYFIPMDFNFNTV